MNFPKLKNYTSLITASWTTIFRKILKHMYILFFLFQFQLFKYRLEMRLERPTFSSQESEAWVTEFRNEIHELSAKSILCTT